MSAVKKLLREQEQDFISLHDLLTEIRDTNTCTLKEAATVLLRLLSNSTELATPSLFSNTVRFGMVKESWSKNPTMMRLQQVALNGEFATPGWEDLDDSIPF